MEGSTPRWHCFTLSPAQVAAGEKRRLAKRAAEVYLTLGKPSGAAVMSTSFNEAGDVTVFFSPEASAQMQALIQEFHGTPCEAPKLDADELAVIAGDLSAKLHLL
jgi:hypothetical protein